MSGHFGGRRPDRDLKTRGDAARGNSTYLAQRERVYDAMGQAEMLEE